MSEVWTRSLWWLAATGALVFTPIAFAYGVTAALVALVVCLLAILGWHLSQLRQLVDWLNASLDAPLPRGRGVWEVVFAGLHRRIRLRRGEQDGISSTLARFRRAVEALPDAIIAFDRHRHIEWLNARAEAYFAISNEVDRGQPLTNLIRQPDFVAYLDRGEFAEPLVYRGGRVEGLTLLVQVVAYGDAQSLLIARDISQIERTERMRSDFIANVSHELKTPLTVVAGFAEVLADNHAALAPAEVERYLALICEQNARMQRLIADLLTLSALESTSPANDEVVDVAALLASIADEARALSAGKHEIRLAIDGPARVRGSLNELRSAFANLTANAVRYTPAGGRIEVAWRADAIGGGELVVADSGIGIAAQHLPRLTERFYRVDRSRSRDTGGTGLGLAIVKHVLSRHHASLAIESEVGKGSRFIVRLPASAIVAASGDEVAAPADSR